MVAIASQLLTGGWFSIAYLWPGLLIALATETTQPLPIAIITALWLISRTLFTCMIEHLSRGDNPTLTMVLRIAMAIELLVILFFSLSLLPLMTLQHLMPILATLPITALWIVLLSRSPYPGLLSEGLGDIPAYYEAARNYRQTGIIHNNFFIADYRGGIYHYIRQTPLPVLLTSHYFRIWGETAYTLDIHAMISAQLLALLAGAATAHIFGYHTPDAWVMASLIFMLLPGLFRLAALGNINNIIALSLLLAPLIP
ncbi:MAG: hypothetical protein HQL49_09125, partial [Gammaproteobacteria bacterium]|nr:hypothetical protein [Gammaproteobacteria bacterium]